MPADRLRLVKRFSYQLQNLNVRAVAESAADMVVLDPSGDDARLTPKQVAALKKKPDGTPRLVLAYLSIGEAENYREYWNPKWRKHPPTWLGPENPDWPGNFKVRFWDRGWQQLILGSKSASLDRIAADGYDGVYLDIVDGYEFWEAHGVGDARQRMINWVVRIAGYGRGLKPGFVIVPQNGAALGSNKTYLATVDGIGRENVFFDGDAPQSDRDVAESITDLAPFRKAHKPVFVIEYCRKNQHKRMVYARATQRGYVPLVAPRELDHLTISP